MNCTARWRRASRRGKRLQPGEASARDNIVDENCDAREDGEDRDLVRIAEMPETNHEKSEAAHQEDAEGQKNQGATDIGEGRFAIPAAIGTIGFIAREAGGAMAARTGRCNHIKW